MADNRARATAAAPRYFKSFHHEASQKTYIDGAVHHNNPVRIADSERKALWPDCDVPDIFLSVGTGSTMNLERARTEKSEHMAAARKGIFSHGRYLYGILRSNMDQTLDCERAWEDYFAGITTSLAKSFSTSRFIRLNPNVGSIPSLDDKDKMGDLRIKAQESQRSDPRIKDIARQLIGSTFYFEPLSVSDPQPDGMIRVQGESHSYNDLGRHILLTRWCILGNVQCRLPQPSQEISLFGKHLLDRMADDGELRFIIFEDGDMKALATIPLTPQVAHAMIWDRMFKVGRVSFSIKHKHLLTQIHLCFGNLTMYPISGFPRSFTRHATDLAPSPLATHFLPSSASFRYAHGSQRQKKINGTWEPPELRGVPHFANLKQYASDPERPLGHNAMVAQTRQNTELDAQQPITPTGIPSPEIEVEETPVPRRTSAIRGAFKALLAPLRSRVAALDGLSPITPGSTSPYVEAWLEEYIQAQESVWDTKIMLNIPSHELVASLQHFNVRPEEFVIYQRWISLLQPDVNFDGSKPGYWVPAISSEPRDFASSAPEGTFHELEGTEILPCTPLVELADTGLMEI